MPEGLRTSGDRRKVLREAKQALDAERAGLAKKVPRGRAERLVECGRRLRQDWELERHFGRDPARSGRSCRAWRWSFATKPVASGAG